MPKIAVEGGEGVCQESGSGLRGVEDREQGGTGAGHEGGAGAGLTEEPGF